MSNEVKKIDELEILINSVQPRFEDVLIDNTIAFKQQAVFAMQAMAANSYLGGVALGNKESLVNAMVNVAALGLTLNPAMKYAYLVPRTISKKPTVCLDVSYMGLVQMVYQSGVIVAVDVEIIYEGDHFMKKGAGNAPEFTPSQHPEREKRPIVGVYCCAKTDKGAYITTHMSIAEVHKIRDTSESWRNEDKRKYSPWSTWSEEMIKKTVIKRASKLWPKSDKSEALMNAIRMLDENGEGLAKTAPVNISVEDTLKEVESARTEDVLQSIWKSVNKLLPAKTHEREEVKNAITQKLNQLREVTDVQPKEEQAA